MEFSSTDFVIIPLEYFKNEEDFDLLQKSILLHNVLEYKTIKLENTSILLRKSSYYNFINGFVNSTYTLIVLKEDYSIYRQSCILSKEHLEEYLGLLKIFNTSLGDFLESII